MRAGLTGKGFLEEFLSCALKAKDKCIDWRGHPALSPGQSQFPSDLLRLLDETRYGGHFSVPVETVAFLLFSHLKTTSSKHNIGEGSFTAWRGALLMNQLGN